VTALDRDVSAARTSARKQFWLLGKLWWLQLRRRPMRLGESPRMSGTPTFLLLSLFVDACLAFVLWQTVARNVRHDARLFAWQILPVLLFGLGHGIATGAVRLQVRGTRNDAFLEPLPLATLARLGRQFGDAIGVIPLSLVVPLAALSVRHAGAFSRIAPALLSPIALAACFVVGQASIKWARALGPAAAGRWGRYCSVALHLVSLGALSTPLGRWALPPAQSRVAQFANAWVGPRPSVFGLYGGFLTLGLLAYYAVCAAERFGFDQLDAQARAPKSQARPRDRLALERVMMFREGGRPSFVLFSLCSLGVAWWLVRHAAKAIPAQVSFLVMVFAIYLGSLQTMAQAGRAARSDLMARPFLAALPMSPHQVLNGKTQALRVLLIPGFVLLALLGALCAWHAGFSDAYRSLLSLLSLYVVAEGAISVAFLSTSIGVLGVAGAQVGSDFSTQLLMLPLFATVMAPNAWVATMACIAVAAVTWESRRAARLSVRWIDDPADNLARETTVWRALLAANMFLAMQALSQRMLGFFELPMAYGTTLAFGVSALLLATLTWRSCAGSERPRFLPNQVWYWPLGVLGGAASGWLALQLEKLIPPGNNASLLELSRGEWIAMFVTASVVAPFAEEYFFRGWLQRAIEADLPANRKSWAFVIGAAAFAFAHFGSPGAPQLMLGLLAGWLYARGRGLWPCILAHALHNGVVSLFGHQLL
jgi:membrane protease YdiL (CAAX protease family)